MINVNDKEKTKIQSKHRHTHILTPQVTKYFGSQIIFVSKNVV